jgi:uncharacterized protein YkwD
LVCLLLGAPASDLEQRATQHVVEQFERVGRVPPAPDSTLGKAARLLAEQALRTSASEAADVMSVSAAVSDAEGYDASPRAVVIRGSPPQHALESFLSRADVNQDPASRMGVSAVTLGDNAAIVALLVSRKAELKPFPRALPRTGGAPTLCGQLVSSLRTADVYVTRPGGEVDKVPLSVDRDSRFCARIEFPSPGRHSVEVIGNGDHGPEVAALFFVDAGAAAPRETHARQPEPTTASETRTALVARINALRKVHRLTALQLDDSLNAVAQAYSEQMAQQNFFAHVAPDGSDLRRRLEKAGYRYQAAGENLGMASGPLAAHFVIEQSPGHLRNLIDERYRSVGIGVAFQELDDRKQAIVTEILANPMSGSANPLAEVYHSVQEKRATLKLPALRRSEVLEKIALEHAQRALELDQPKMQLPGTPIQERIFAELKDIKTTSVDFFVSENPRLVIDSKNLANRKNDRIGIGAVRGNSAKYGKDAYWVVVIYAAAN